MSRKDAILTERTPSHRHSQMAFPATLSWMPIEHCSPPLITALDTVPPRAVPLKITPVALELVAHCHTGDRLALRLEGQGVVE